MLGMGAPREGFYTHTTEEKHTHITEENKDALPLLSNQGTYHACRGWPVLCLKHRPTLSKLRPLPGYA